MKKRILCAILTLIMLVSLVPAGVINASAASNAVSESAITVLKQWENYSKDCDADGYIGYGTKCTNTKGAHGAGLHTIDEHAADVALRDALKSLDTGINNFASKNGLALSQGQHDALVLFSFENGLAWTTGTGDFRTAVVKQWGRNEFLQAICWWDRSTADDSRRMVEANMYLNGAYSSVVPSSFIRVEYNAGSKTTDGFTFTGKMTEAVYQYYDLTTNPKANLVPTMDYHKFLGWYADNTILTSSLTKDHNNKVLTAHYQASNALTGDDNDPVYYAVKKTSLASQIAYAAPCGMETKMAIPETIIADRDYLDENGNRWLRIRDNLLWVVLGPAGSYDPSGSTSSSKPEMDITVTVTNSYVRSRKENNIYSAQNGTYYQGEKLRIIDVADSKYDTFTWGQVAKSATDDTAIGWVALIYTDYETVKNSASTNTNNSTVIARATINVTQNNGYVNVRSEAGTGNKIVGALANKTTVDLYETKFVNGHEWGRCNTGWFSLTYADVVRLVEDNSYATDTGLLSYVFYGELLNLNIYKEPDINADRVITRQVIGPNITITHLKADKAGNTFGKIAEGWVQVSDSNGDIADVDLDDTYYIVTSAALSVRNGIGYNYDRTDSLSKNVEFIVNRHNQHQIKVLNDTVWGYTYKIGEDGKDEYAGWVDLTTANSKRVTMPTLDVSKDEHTATISGKIATVVGTDSVNVRVHSGATYKKIGTLAGNTTVAVWEENDGWYKVDSNRNGVYDYDGDGWVSGKYLNVRDGSVSNGTASEGTTGSNVSETGLGIVSNTYTGVNVRSNPGTGSALLGKILAGTTVEIYETTTHGTSKWGRTDEGWVCMDYIQMIGDLPADILAGLTGNSGSTSTTITSSVYTGTLTKPATVYKEADNSAEVEIVRELNAGDPVTLHEIVVVTTREADVDSTTDGNGNVVTSYKEYTTNWARINDGWVRAPEIVIELNPLAEKTYTVTGNDTLNVRLTPGINGALLTEKQLKKGDQVVITKLDIAEDGTVWGYIQDRGGWASLAYMTEGALSASQIPSDKPVEDNTTSTDPVIGSTGNTGNTGNNGYVNNAGGYRYTGKVIRTTSLNVRATASQTANKTATLSGGDALVIYETTISEGMAWGRCDAGWVYLYYVDLVPCNTAVDAKVVYTEGTIAYTDASCSSVAGTYSRMSVVDIYEVVGNMAKTDLGWVNTINLG